MQSNIFFIWNKISFKVVWFIIGLKYINFLLDEAN